MRFMFDIPQRALDYTPPPVGEIDHMGRRPMPNGGGEAFLSFIEIELKPAIEAHYPVDRQRQTLFGHSYGGLFTLYTLFNKPAAFNTYQPVYLVEPSADFRRDAKIAR